MRFIGIVFMIGVALVVLLCKAAEWVMRNSETSKWG